MTTWFLVFLTIVVSNCCFLMFYFILNGNCFMNESDITVTTVIPRVVFESDYPTMPSWLPLKVNLYYCPTFSQGLHVCQVCNNCFIINYTDHNNKKSFCIKRYWVFYLQLRSRSCLSECCSCGKWTVVRWK